MENKSKKKENKLKKELEETAFYDVFKKILKNLSKYLEDLIEEGVKKEELTRSQADLAKNVPKSLDNIGKKLIPAYNIAQTIKDYKKALKKEPLEQAMISDLAKFIPYLGNIWNALVDKSFKGIKNVEGFKKDLRLKYGVVGWKGGRGFTDKSPSYPRSKIDPFFKKEDLKKSLNNLKNNFSEAIKDLSGKFEGVKNSVSNTMNDLKNSINTNGFQDSLKKTDSDVKKASKDLSDTLRLANNNIKNAAQSMEDLDSDGIETTTIGDGIYFDQETDGFAEKSSWADNSIIMFDKYYIKQTA